jgi:MoaA/NifB/PqqE/SkfB family radical SAM enzyme
MNLGRIAWNMALSRNPDDAASQKKAVSFFSRKGSLVVNLTTRCNFSCKHCMRKLSDQKDFPLDLLEKIVIDAKKFNFGHMSLTGGEPLLYPHLHECIDLLVKNGYIFNMATNGFVLENFFGLIKKNKKNIQFIQFSLDDIDAKRHDDLRRAGSFEKLTLGARFCHDNKIPFRFMTAVSAANSENIFDIALFAKKKGAFSLACATVLPCPRSQNNHLVLNEDQRNRLFLNVTQLSRLLRFPITMTAGIRTQDILRICSGLSLNEIALDVDGYVVRCCDLANFDDEDIRAKAMITSAKNKSFGEILLKCADHVRNFEAIRIQDYQNQTNPDTTDFNSCFYCLGKLTNHS